MVIKYDKRLILVIAYGEVEMILYIIINFLLWQKKVVMRNPIAWILIIVLIAFIVRFFTTPPEE